VSTVCVSDAELVARTRQGDTAAFEELVTRHRSAVYRAAMAALHSPADAEDAAQDAFLVAYRRLDTFRGRASFKTWLLSIAWHQAINRRRTLTRVWRAVIQPRTNDEADAAIGCLPAADPSPEAAAHGDQLRRAVRDAIRGLSPKLRDALLLAQAGEYTYEEIGEMLNAPLGTIKWRVSEARRLVRRQLHQRGFTHDV
jgi:RNA polymerase sigma-70 factor, ECF subfamily